MSIEQAVGMMSSGCSLAIGSSGGRRQPMALIHQIIRNRLTDLHVVAPSSRVSVDILIGAGCVRRVEFMYIGMERYGLAPNFRRAAQEGRIETQDWSESSIINRLRAAAYGLPFMPSTALLGTSMAEHLDGIREISCPFTGQKLHAVSPATTGFTIVHGYTGDAYGNVQWPAIRDTDHLDREIAQAATNLIVSVEKIVSHETVQRNPWATWIPGQWVKAIVEAPFGAHPGPCDGLYEGDDDHMRLYAESARDPAEFEEYLDEYVYGTRDHWEYLERVGGLRKLWQLRVTG